MDKKPLLVSACLLGVKCRYDGGEQYHPAIIELMERYTLVAVCPEVLGDMPTPRTPAEMRGARVVSADGEDRTEKFRLGAERALKAARRVGAGKALLKSRSPSCGNDGVYDGTFSGKLAPGRGVAAALLEENGVKVFSELDIAGLY
ncbi:MAG: DUF523 domain-containing protein [Elusimicrobiales bacterium]|nr:DUF523 domain-containing protein [Elusimicrobiales bacterium]